MIKASDKFFFLVVATYLPFSFFLIFWLYSVSIIFLAESWQYRLFYGADGRVALLWLLAVLLPAFLFLILNARKMKLMARLTGAIGFYCLLGSLISSYHVLVMPGLVFIVISVSISRWLKR